MLGATGHDPEARAADRDRRSYRGCVRRAVGEPPGPPSLRLAMWSMSPPGRVGRRPRRTLGERRRSAFSEAGSGPASGDSSSSRAGPDRSRWSCWASTRSNRPIEPKTRRQSAPAVLDGGRREDELVAHAALELQRHSGGRPREPEGADRSPSRRVYLRHANRPAGISISSSEISTRAAGIEACSWSSSQVERARLRFGQAVAVGRLRPGLLLGRIGVARYEPGDSDVRLAPGPDHERSDGPPRRAANPNLIGREGRRQMVRSELMRVGGHVRSVYEVGPLPA